MSRQNKIIVTLPKLYTAGNNIHKPWFVYYTCRDPLSGKKKRFRIYEGFSSLATAQAKKKHGEELCRTWTDKLQNGYNPFERDDVIYMDDLRYRNAGEKYKKLNAAAKTFRYFASMFMEQKKNAVRLSTEHTYRSKMRTFTEFLEKHNMDQCDVSMFTLEHSEKFIRYLFTEKKLTNKTVNGYIRLLREFFDYINLVLSVQNRQIENVFTRQKTYKESTKKPQVYSLHQIRRLGEVMAPEDPQMWLVVRLLFNCFIRPIEMRFLKIKHVDFVAGRILIPREFSKNKKDDMVDIPNYLLDDMIDMGYHKAPAEHYMFTLAGKPGPLPLGKNHFYRTFVKFREKAGLPDNLILYAFKHTGVAELKKSGADWLDIKNQLRHHSLDQVIEYAHSLLGQSSQHIKEKSPKI